MASDGPGSEFSSDQPPSMGLASEILRESRLALDRQKEGISQQQRTLVAFIRYHLLFLAVLFSAIEFGDITIGSNRYLIGVTVVVQFLGIVLLLHAYRTLQTSKDGFDSNELLSILKQGRAEVSAIEELIDHNEHLYGKNQDIVNSHRKFWYASTLVLAFSFGVLISLIM